MFKIKMLIAVVVLLSLLTCEKKQKEMVAENSSSLSECCNVDITFEDTTLINSLKKYACIYYYNGGEIRDYSMCVNMYFGEKMKYLLSNTVIYTNEYLKGGKERYIETIDTIYDYMTIKNLLDSINIHDPLKFKCGENDTGDQSEKEGYILIYYKNEKGKNCFSADVDDELIANMKLKYYFSLFNNKDIFKISRTELNTRKLEILDSLNSSIRQH